MTLREQVAEALRRADARHPNDAFSVAHSEDRADAVIRVVLGVVADEITTLGTDWTIIRAGVTRYESAEAADFKREALAVVERLREGVVSDGE